MAESEARKCRVRPCCWELGIPNQVSGLDASCPATSAAEYLPISGAGRVVI